MLRSFTLALVFLTRIPVRTAPAREGELARALAYFPAVGLAIGALAGAVAWLCRDALAPSVGAVAVVAVLAALTGGLHLDGLADVFDAWAGGRGDRERMLAIMRDSRIGALGTVAVALVLIAKVAALTELLRRGAGGGDTMLAAVIACPAATRFAVVPLVAFFPYARSQGLGVAFRSDHGTIAVLIATAIALVLAVWLGAVWAFLAALVTAVLFGSWVYLQLRGLTGDVYGAAIEIAEVAFLVTATVELGAGRGVAF
jgi:adenosylcobinamide-GDP ribazoletransferase